jgi:two-component system phosphate regulon response regulator PhoB
MPANATSVLIVEDSADTREMYASYFRRPGLRDLHGRGRVRGLASVRACGPDMILLDLSLPELDGWELARRFRADPGTRCVPIIAVSARADLSARMMSAGVDLFVPKPVTPADLLARVAGLRFPNRPAGG